jgi:hypothetical protein
MVEASSHRQRSLSAASPGAVPDEPEPASPGSAGVHAVSALQADDSGAPTFEHESDH